MTAPPRVIERIKSHIAIAEDGCWLWQRSTVKGYGQIVWHEDGKHFRGLTHRLLYEAMVGEVSGGLTLDHMCHDPDVCQLNNECPHRRCCNPDHLKPATRAENAMRGNSGPARNATKTHCPAGHAYDDTNTYVAPNGWRQCQTCRRSHINAFRARRGLPSWGGGA